MATETYGYPKGATLEIYGELQVKDHMMKGESYHLQFRTGMVFADEDPISIEEGVERVAKAYGIEWHDKTDKDVTVHFTAGVGLKFDSILAFKMFCMSLAE